MQNEAYRRVHLRVTETGAIVQKRHLEMEYSMLALFGEKLEKSEMEELLRLLNKVIGGIEDE